MSRKSSYPLYGNYGYGSRWSNGYSGSRWSGGGAYTGGFSDIGMYSNLRAYEFETGTVTAAKTLSNNNNIHVFFGGADEVVATKNSIQLPAIDPVNGISHADAKVVRGYTDHEIVKRRVSDLDVYNKLTEGPDKQLAAVFRGIEDGRIAKAGKTLYQGTGDNIEAAVNKVANSISTQLAKNPKLLDDIEKVGPALVSLASRKESGYSIFAYDRIMDKLHPLDRALIEEIGQEAAALPTGAEDYGVVNETEARKGLHASLNLAKKASEMFALRAQEKREEDNGGGGNPSGNPGGGDPDSGPPSNGIGGEGDEELNFDISKAANEALKRDRFEKSENVYLPGVRDMDIFISGAELIEKTAKQRSVSQAVISSTGLDRCNKSIRRSSSSLAVMKTALERLMLSKQIEGRDEAKGGGKLNPRRLVGAYNGDENVFTKRVDDDSINTAVQLVIDMSGSMSGEKIDLALQSTLLLSEALAKCNVPFEIVGFRTTGAGARNGKSPTIKKMVQDMIDDGRTNRYDTIEMTTFKSFAERYQMCLPAIGNMAAGGANCDGESILYASQTLLKRSERKKIMMVLSDGEPAFGYHNCSNGAVDKYVRDSVKNIEKQNVHVIGIGICSSAVKSYYTNHIVVNQLHQLPKAILREITLAIG
jgi:cobalamin biosynthesis protein CobT